MNDIIVTLCAVWLLLLVFSFAPMALGRMQRKLPSTRKFIPAPITRRWDE